MRRIKDWLAKFSLIEIAAAGFIGGVPELISVRRFPGWVRLGAGLIAVAFAAYAAWALFTDATLHPVSIGAIFVALVAKGSYANRLYLTDNVLALGAAWAATKRGHQFQPGRWRLKGAEAEAIGAELVRLHGWHAMTDAPTAVERLRQRERILLANARGPLREYLQPVLTATGLDPEPLQVESASHTPGAPWPMMSYPEPEWPVLPMPQEGRPS